MKMLDLSLSLMERNILRSIQSNRRTISNSSSCQKNVHCVCVLVGEESSSLFMNFQRHFTVSESVSFNPNACLNNAIKMKSNACEDVCACGSEFFRLRVISFKLVINSKRRKCSHNMLLLAACRVMSILLKSCKSCFFSRSL